MRVLSLVRDVACACTLIAVMWCIVGSGSASAAAYPEKPIRLVVGAPPGTAIDQSARVLAEELTKQLGQPVIIENLAGAGGIIAAQAVAKAVPDGYTILLAPSNLSVARLVHSEPGFDPLKDFAPISIAGTLPYMVVVQSKSPATNFGDLLKLAKDKPGALNLGLSGPGGPDDLASRQLMRMTGTSFTGVTYKGSPAALNDLLGGQIDLYFATIPTALSMVRAGKLRALAVTSASRSFAAPEVPTVAEAGVVGYEFVVWFGYLAPSGTPPAAIARLNTAITRAMQATEVSKRFQEWGTDPTVSTPAEFGARIRDDYERGKQFVGTAKTGS